MKKRLALLPLVLLFASAAHGQGFELACAAGTTPLLAPTYNPSTQLLRAWVCVDATGHVSSPVFALAAGAVTSVFTRTGAVVAASGDYTVAQVTGAAPLASPTFTGTVTFPTNLTIPTPLIVNPSAGTNPQIGTTNGNEWFIFDKSTFGGDFIQMGPWVNNADSNGISLNGADGSTVVLDCTDISCSNPFQGISINAAGASGQLQLNQNGVGLTLTSTGLNVAKYQPSIQPVSVGIQQPVIIAFSTFRGRTTALTTTTVFTTSVATAASYRITANAFCDTTVATATATLTVVYTDSSGTAITTTGTGAICTTLGNASQQIINLPNVRVKNATAITWAIAIANAPNYDASIVVEQLTSN